MYIIKPSSPMHFDANGTSNLETECLFGEKVKILTKEINWYYCKLLTDKYCGWLKKKDLGYLPSPTHRIISTRSFLFTDKDVKSSIINYLPLGAKLNVEKIEDGWAKILLSNTNKTKLAYVFSKNIISIDAKKKDWVSIAEQLIGTPYKWGGRDTMGIDCSALLQLSYQTFGQDIPRNTNDQIKLNKKKIIDLEEIDRGFAVFWEGHVGIMVDKINCIHANGFHMKTIVEPLKKIILRMGVGNPIRKIMDFN